MVDMSRFGYRHATAFRKAKDVPPQVWDKILSENSWYFTKLVLLHPECPHNIRLKFATDKSWYKRLTAICAKNSTIRYMALNDPDPRIRRIVSKEFYWMVLPMLKSLEITKGV